MRVRAGRRVSQRLFDSGVLCAAGLWIASVIGFLQDQTPFGDDAIYHVGLVKNLASNFPYLWWDPHIFAGSVPIIGLSWLTYPAPALLVRMGLDAISSFHIEFISAFLLFGLSVYYFARSVGLERILSFSMSILGWSTNTYWNLTIWGGAYDRAFTIPLLFIAVGATYRYASQVNYGGRSTREYWLCLAAWTLVYLGDVFVAIAGTLLTVIFLLFCAGIDNLATGLKRIGTFFLPLLGLTLWQIIPLAIQALAYSSYRHQVLVPNYWNMLLLPGAKWTSTLNPVYLPTILIVATCCGLFRARVSPVQKALLVSMMVMGSYWLVMGWVPVLWPYLPRLMATYSSVENLGWIFLMTIPLLFTILRGRLATMEKPLFRIRRGRRFSLTGQRFFTILQTVILLFITLNALATIPSITPANWQPLTDQLNSELKAGLGTPSNDYRISLQNRFLTRSFQYYQPDRFDTGGRTELLNLDPLYHSWYATEVFYKNDISSIKTLYIDDQPSANVSSFLESSRNFAGEAFWLDWYAVNAVIFDDYTSGRTIGNYSDRPYAYTVSRTNTTYSIPQVIVKPQDSTGILTATNATIVGFYSAGGDSQNEYNSLLSMLASIGLGPRFVVPLYLHSLQEVTAARLDVVVTDSYTYAQYTSQMQVLLETSSVVVVSSVDGQLGSQPVVNQNGNRVLVNVPFSFSQLVNGHEEGAYYFAKSAPVLQINSFNISSSTYQGPINTSLSPTSWTPVYRTPNAQGALLTTPNSIIVNLTSTDTTQSSQFNIGSHLPTLVPLLSNLTISLSIQATQDVRLGLSFSPPTSCCPNYVGLDENVTSGNPVQLQIPYSRFDKWDNISRMFGVTQDLSIALNLPPGIPSITVRFVNVSLSVPAYTKSALPKPISLADDGLVTHDLGVTGIGLLNGFNSSTSILNLASSTPQAVTTLASFSGGRPGEEYDSIITVGGNGQGAPMFVLFSQPPSSLVGQRWLDNQDMVASSIPRGFHGLLWKETYNKLWTLDAESGSTLKGLTYYYAGPGMIYISMPIYANGIKASLVSLNLPSVTLFSIPIATIAALALFRKRIPAFGRIKTKISEQGKKP